MNHLRHPFLLATFLSVALMGCASLPAPKSQDCVLGVPNGAEVLASPWGDPMDELITRSLDQGQGWSCPPAKPATAPSAG